MLDIVQELERRLSLVNAVLQEIRSILEKATVLDTASYKDALEAVLGAEQLSRWKRSPLPEDPAAALSFAKTRAEFKAKTYGKPYVVVQDGNRILVMPKEEIQSGRVIGVPKDTPILYEAGR